MWMGWREIDGYWYFLEDSTTADIPQGAMRTGWFDSSSNRYYLETTDDGDIPLGAMTTGWATIGGNEYYFMPNEEEDMPLGAMYKDWLQYMTTIDGEDVYRWAFFHLSTGVCTTKGQVSKGCAHGNTTYNDNCFDIDISDISYTYDGTKFSNAIEGGIVNWESAGLGINFTYEEPVSGDVSINITCYDSVLNQNYLAITEFATVTYSIASKIEPRTGDWDVTSIHINEGASTSSIRTGIIAHEIGHAFGLDHRDADEESLMFSGIAKLSINNPQAVDISNMNHLY